MKPFSVAVVQLKITTQNPEANFRRIEQFIQRAVAQKAQVVVFPEDCVTGSIFGDRSKLDSTGAYLARFRALAKQYKIDIVAGSMMEGTPRGACSSTYYIDARGRVLGSYQKTNLFHSERYFLNPGTEVAVFDTRYGKAGLVICWDIMFPELFRRMMRLGVQVVYCPSYWYQEIAEKGLQRNPKSEEHLLDAVLATRAIENNIVMVYANAAGVTVNPNKSVDTLTGHSQITAPFVGALQRLAHNREGVFVQEVDLSVLREAEAAYRLRQDLEKRVV